MVQFTNSFVVRPFVKSSLYPAILPSKVFPMKGATQTVRIGFSPENCATCKGQGVASDSGSCRLVGAKEASWSYNLPFVVLGVMVAAAEKCSVSGLEPSIVWSVAEPDGVGPRFILALQNPSKPSLKPSRVEYLFEKSSADWSRVVA